MLKFLNLKQESFGLDISDFSLKIAKIKKRGPFFDIASFNRAQNKPGIIKKGEIRKPDELAEIIKKTIKEIKGEKLRTRNAVVSLPEEKAFLEVIQMPRLSKEDLKSAIVFEAENHIPLPLEEVYLDYQIIPSFKENLDHLDILVAAFPKKIIDNYIICLEKANIKPVVFEVESFAIVRSLIKDEASANPVFLIDFGTDQTTIIIFSGRSIRFTFSIPISSQNLTESISRTMRVNLIKAEELKIKHGLKEKLTEDGKQVFEALVPPLTDLSEQIQKYLNYYKDHAGHEHLLLKNKEIKEILICGGGAKLKGLSDFLFSHLKIPVKIGNPWINILPSAEQPKEKTLIYEKEESLGYVTALGLALRGIKKE